jgi:hypothetical protein
MKRNLVLLSITLLLTQAAALAVDTTGGAIKIKSSRKGVIPPPPKEAMPGNTTMMVPNITPTPSAKASQIVAPDTGDAQLVSIGEGGPYTAKNTQQQRFADYLDLKKEQEQAKLTLSIKNNGFKWFRLLVANQVVATEKSIDRSGSGKLDVSGIIQPGSNQVVIQAGGAPGSTIEWKLTTVATAKLDRVDPDEALIGDTVAVKGQHFALNPSSNEVSFGSAKGSVVSAKATELKVKVPQNAEPGDVQVTAKVNGIKTNAVKMKVRGIPQVTGASLQGVPPGQTIAIYGKNFSKQIGENRVFFDDTPAEIVAGSTTELTVVVPFTPYREGHGSSQVKVQVGKVMSKTAAAVTVGPQMFNDPNNQTPDTPGYMSR